MINYFRNLGRFDSRNFGWAAEELETREYVHRSTNVSTASIGDAYEFMDPQSYDDERFIFSLDFVNNAVVISQRQSDDMWVIAFSVL